MTKQFIEKISWEDVIKYQNKHLLNIFLHYNIFELPETEVIPNYTAFAPLLIANIANYNNEFKLIISYNSDNFDESVSSGQIYPYKEKRNIWAVSLMDNNIKAYGISLGQALARLLIILNYDRKE